MYKIRMVTRLGTCLWRTYVSKRQLQSAFELNIVSSVISCLALRPGDVGHNHALMGSNVGVKA